MDLADAITLLRDQVAEAQSRIADPAGAGDRGVLFTLGEITLDLGLELTGTKGVDGGLRWSVISLGGRKENGSKATHTVSVTLTPHRPDGGDVDVSDEE
ncbi:trypco2 family protein [Streptomyces anulatus]